MNLAKQIIKAVVQVDSERGGSADDESKIFKKLNKLADSTKPEDHKRLVKALGELAAYGINLEDI